MKDIKIQVPGGYLDVDTNIGFGVTYSVDDIKNISKRNSAATKTVTALGTDNNNKIFGLLFDLKSDFSGFNPNFKTPAKIIVNSTIILDGFLQLKNIKKLANLNQEGNEIQYECVIFDDVIDFYSSLGDNLITELSFSANNHTYDKAIIEDSWTNDYTDVYTYPLFWKDSDIYTTKDFKPSIFHYNYITKIFDFTSTKYGGTLFSDPTFLKEIIPYNGPLVALSPTEFTRRNFRVSMSAATEQLATRTLIGGVFSDVFAGVKTHKIASVNQSNLTASTLTDETTPPNFDPNNHWNVSTQKWTIDANGSYNWEGGAVLDVEYRTWRNDITSITGISGSYIIITFADNHNFNWGNNPKVILSGASLYNGTYNVGSFSYDPNSMGPKSIKINGVTHTSNLGSGGTFSWETYQQTYNWSSTNPTNETSNTNNSIWNYRFDLNILKNGTSISTHNSPYTAVPKSTGTLPTFTTANTFTVNQEIYVPMNRPNLAFLSGDTLSFNIGISSSSTKFLKYSDNFDGFAGGNDSVPVYVYVSIKNLSSFSQATFVKGTANASPDLTDGDTIQLSSFIPKDVKMKDMLGDLIKRYNLYITTDKNDKNKILLDTRDAFYSSSTQTLDWTQLKDYSVADKIEYISELQNKEILLTYKKDSDVWNKNYTESTGGDNKGDIFGQKTIEFDNEFAKGQKKIELSIFSPTPGVSNSVNNRFVVPAIPTLAPKSNIRVLLYNGLKAPMNTSGGAGVYSWTYNWYSGNVLQTTNYLNYPQALHQDDVTSPTEDINFGEVPWEYYAGSFTTDNNLYNKYWKNYIEQIGEGRLVTSRFYLTEVDINRIKNSFNTKIFVGGDYFYLNKIVDFDPTKEGETTEVQLLKISAPVVFTPTNTTGDTVYTEYESYRLVNPTLTDVTNTVLSKNVIVLGENNFVGEDSEGSIVLGNDNNISNLSKNSLVLGTGITATESGYIYLENAVIDSNGQIIDLSGNSISNDFCSTGIQTSAISGCSTVTIYDGDVFAASFSGGGSVIGGSGTNLASGVYSFIGGGKSNIANNTYSAIVGGYNNLSSSSSFIGGGYGNSATTVYSAIIGGILNTASGQRSVIIGGQYNLASGTDSFIGCGFSNSATTDSSSVVGGNGNLASGLRSSVIGGSDNKASTFDAHIGGGTYNVASGQRSAVIAGYLNSATTLNSSVVGGDSNIASGYRSTVVGGLSNSSSGINSFVAAGGLNQANGVNSSVFCGKSNLASGNYSSVIGGVTNSATTANSSVVGGRQNLASGTFSSVVGGRYNSSSTYSFIGGGISNSATTSKSAVVGGQSNLTSGVSSFIGGGKGNQANNVYSSVIGGQSNLASGYHSSVIGGSGNTISGQRSVVLGGQSIIGVSGDTVYVPSISFKNENISWVFKEIEIGDWDMNATNSVSIAHSLSSTEWKTARNIECVVRNDADTIYYKLDGTQSNGSTDGSVADFNSTDFYLLRTTSGWFDSTNFDSTSYNRGWITFWYKPDA